MEEDSPYQASQVVLVSSTDTGGMQVPRHITRPITHLWILLCIQAGISLVVGLTLAISAPISLLFQLLIFGGTMAIYASFAVGVYMRVLWIAIVVATLNGVSLLMGLLSLARGDGSIILLLIAAVTTYFSVRGAIAIRAYHRYVEKWWRGKA